MKQTKTQKQKRQTKTTKAIALFEIFLTVFMTVAVAFILNASLVSSWVLGYTGEGYIAKKTVNYEGTGGSFEEAIANARGPSGEFLSADLTNSPTATGSTTWYGRILEGHMFDPETGTPDSLQASGGALAAGAAWALIAYGAVKFIGPMLGLDKGMQSALESSLAGGAFVAGTLNAAGGSTAAFGGLFAKDGTLELIGQKPVLSGLVVAAIIFVLVYKEEKTKTVTFTCNPWEPPIGGTKCEQCNVDPFRPCSEYRCKALGQACQLLNPGTGKEKCAWVNPKDVKSAIILPDANAFLPSYLKLKFTPLNAIRPGDRGVTIVNVNDAKGCIPAFTPLQFGFTTIDSTTNLGKPVQCKLDYSRANSTGKPGFDAMQFYVGGSNYYDINHTQIMKLPNPAATSVDTSAILKNGDTMSLYVRCMDKNGNVNEDDFVFNFCVQKGPDTTPPIIESTSINNNGYVRYKVDSVPIEVYTNEPAQCKWSRVDKDYKDMENSMTCASNIAQINKDLSYTCSGNLTSIKNSEANNFFFRCKDYDDGIGFGNNEMQQSHKLTLIGSQPLKISAFAPNGTIRGNTEVVPVTLEVKTLNGAEEGKALCYYSTTGLTDSYYPMYESNSYVSRQTQDLQGSSGGTNYRYYFRCIDAGGNSDSADTSFTLFVDKDAPAITRVYKEVPDALKIVTNEEAQCAYSLINCDFNITEGQQMVNVNGNATVNAAEWKSNAMYYIKCKDSYGNNPGNYCSMIVNAAELVKK
jgi:hypothetical protein